MDTREEEAMLGRWQSGILATVLVTAFVGTGCTMPGPTNADVISPDREQPDSGADSTVAQETSTPATCASSGQSCVTQETLAGTPRVVFDASGKSVIAWSTTDKLSTVRWNGMGWESLTTPAAVVVPTNNDFQLQAVGTSVYLLASTGTEVVVLKLNGSNWEAVTGSPLVFASTQGTGNRPINVASAVSSDRLYVATNADSRDDPGGGNNNAFVQSFDGTRWTPRAEALGFPFWSMETNRLCVRPNNTFVGFLFYRHFLRVMPSDSNSLAWAEVTRSDTLVESLDCVDDGSRQLSLMRANDTQNLTLLQRTNGDFSALGTPIVHSPTSTVGWSQLILDAANAPTVGYLNSQSATNTQRVVFKRLVGSTWQDAASTPSTAIPQAGFNVFSVARRASSLGVVWTAAFTPTQNYLRYDEIPLN